MSELYHYGVKGMKWGVRRNRDSGGSTGGLGRFGSNAGAKSDRTLRKAQKAYDKNVKKNWYKAHNIAAERFNNGKELARINKKYEGDYRNPKYEQEIEAAWNREYGKAFVEMFGDRPA